MLDRIANGSAGPRHIEPGGEGKPGYDARALVRDAVFRRPFLRAKAFLRHEAGATAIEFSLVAIPFLGLLAATFDLGLSYFYRTNVNAAVQQAVRQIKTGAVQGAGVASASDFTKKYLCRGANTVTAAFIDCNKMIVDVRTATSFQAADLSTPFYKTASTNMFCPGAPNSVTIVRVAYPMPIFLPILQGFGSAIAANRSGLVNDVPGNSGWKLLIVAAAAFKTEPYPSGQYTANKGC